MNGHWQVTVLRPSGAVVMFGTSGDEGTAVGVAMRLFPGPLTGVSLAPVPPRQARVAAYVARERKDPST